MSRRLELIALENFPHVQPGDDLAGQINSALLQQGLALQSGDVLVLAQKIVSKAEGRYRDLADVEVSAEAAELATQVDKDPRLVELILQESVAVVRQRPGVLIVEHRQGLVHANAGIDQSNIEQSEDKPRALLLPFDSDKSAAELLAQLEAQHDKSLAVIINDSAGRAWRNGTSGIAIGVAGFDPVLDMIGGKDMFGNELRVTTIGVADELAAAASFVMGQAGESCPVVLVRGANLERSTTGHSSQLIRDKEMDLFR